MKATEMGQKEENSMEELSGQMKIEVEPGATVEEVEAQVLDQMRPQARMIAEAVVRDRDARTGAGGGGGEAVEVEGQAEEGLTHEKRKRLGRLYVEILKECGDSHTAVRQLAGMLCCVMKESVIKGKEREAVAAVARELEARIMSREEGAGKGND